MTLVPHDYSRHTDDDLRGELKNLDVQRHPERALGMIRELERRLEMARQSAAVVSSEIAIRTGAHFSEVDARARRPLFWRLYWWGLLLSGAFAVLQSIVISTIDVFVKEHYSGSPDGMLVLEAALIFLTIALISFAYWRALLGVVTKRTYGSLALRVIKIEQPSDAA